jgi:uracil-DNA glycosylase
MGLAIYLAFPFVKNGPIHAPLRQGEINLATSSFAMREIEIVSPRLLLLCGRKAQIAIRDIDPSKKNVVHLPHPAARLSEARHHQIWAAELRDFPLDRG